MVLWVARPVFASCETQAGILDHCDETIDVLSLCFCVFVGKVAGQTVKLSSAGTLVSSANLTAQSWCICGIDLIHSTTWQNTLMKHLLTNLFVLSFL